MYLDRSAKASGNFADDCKAKSAAIAAKHLAEGSSDDFYKAKLATAEYFATHQMPFAAAYAAEVTGGAASTLGLAETLF